MKNGAFWDVTPWGSWKNQLFLRSVLQMLVTAVIVRSLSILVALMMEGISSNEISVLTIATRGNVPEDGIFYV
jgi:hypothetical protein